MLYEVITHYVPPTGPKQRLSPCTGQSMLPELTHGGFLVFFKQFRQPLSRILQAMLLCTALGVQADNQLPDIGTAGVSALSIDQEVVFGNSFMRFARASLPIIDDPVLNEYVSRITSYNVCYTKLLRLASG